MVEVLKVTRTKPRVAVAAKSAPVAEAAVAKPERSKSLQGLISFGEFWVDFIVGDDWRIAAGIVAAFILTALIKTSSVVWGIVPLFVALFLSYSLSRVVRSAQ